MEKIVVSGGYLGRQGSAQVEVYDVQEDSWEEGRTNKYIQAFLPVHFTTVLVAFGGPSKFIPGVK